MRKRIFAVSIVLTVAAIGLLAISAVASSRVSALPAAAPSGVVERSIRIDNFSFSPQSVRVRAGTQVTWINGDDVPHKVVSTNKVFTSPVLDTDGRFSYTFKTPGTYAYFCSIHPSMTATVIVE